MVGVDADLDEKCSEHAAVVLKKELEGGDV